MSRPALFIADGPRFQPGSQILSAIPSWIEAPFTEVRQSVESRLSLTLPLSVVDSLEHTQPGRIVRQDFGDRIVEWIIDRRSLDASRSQARLDLVPIHHLLRWAPIRRERVGFPADTAVASVHLNAREMIGSWVVPTMTQWGYDIFRTGRIGPIERLTVGMDGWTPLELMGWLADELDTTWDLRADEVDQVYRIDFGFEEDVDFDVVLSDPGSLLSYAQDEDLSSTHTAVLVTGETPRGGSQPSTLGTVSLRVDESASVDGIWRVGVSVPGFDEPSILEDGQWVGSYLAWPTLGGITYAEILETRAPGVFDLDLASGGPLPGTPVTLTSDTSGTRESILKSPTGLERIGAANHLIGMVDGDGRGEQNYHPDPFHADTDDRGQLWDGQEPVGQRYAGVYTGVRYPVPPTLESPELVSTGLPTYHLLNEGPLEHHIEVDEDVTVTGFTVTTPSSSLAARLIVLEGTSFGSGSQIANVDIRRTTGINHVYSGLSISLSPGNKYTFRVQSETPLAGPFVNYEVRILDSGVSYPYETGTSEPLDLVSIVGGSEGLGVYGPLYNIRFTADNVSGTTVKGLPPDTNLNAMVPILANRVVARDFYAGADAEYRPRYTVIEDGASLTTNAQGEIEIDLEPGEDGDTDFTVPHYVYFFTGQANDVGLQASVIFFPDGSSASALQEVGDIGKWRQPDIPRFPDEETDELPRAQVAFRPPETVDGAVLPSVRFDESPAPGVLSLFNLPPGFELWPGDILSRIGFRAQVWSHAIANESGEASVRCVWLDGLDTLEFNTTLQLRRPPAIPDALIGQSRWVVVIQLLPPLAPEMRLEGQAVRRIPEVGVLPGVAAFAGIIQAPVELPTSIATVTHQIRVERFDTGALLASADVEVNHAPVTFSFAGVARENLPFSWPANAPVRFAWVTPTLANQQPWTFFSIGRNVFQTPDDEVPMIETSHANKLYAYGQRKLRKHRYGLVEPTVRIPELVRQWDLPTDAEERLRPGSRVRVRVPSVGIDEVFVVDQIRRDGNGEAVVSFGARSNRVTRQIPAPGRSFASVRYDVTQDQQTFEVRRERPVDNLPTKGRPSAFFPDDIDGSDPSPPEVNLGFL